jgi:monofunctional biosynthetic peptidoglycan transglycosylase
VEGSQREAAAAIRPCPQVVFSTNVPHYGAYGVYAAIQTFFGKRPSELQTQEAALLAAVLPNPARLHVRNPSAYVRERAGWIEEQMTHLGGPAYLQNL